MNTTTRTLTGLALASAAVTVALATAPANARPVPAPVDAPPAADGHGVHRHWPTGGSGRPAHHHPSTTASSDSSVDWPQVGYGAAAGFALTTAAGATLILVRRRQHLPHHT